MGATLRVDPELLRSAAKAQEDVGTRFTGIAVGESLTSAGSGVSGLFSEAACRFAAALFDTATTTVHDDIAAHASNLSAAADRYHRMDDELGRRLRAFAG